MPAPWLASWGSRPRSGSKRCSTTRSSLSSSSCQRRVICTPSPNDGLLPGRGSLGYCGASWALWASGSSLAGLVSASMSSPLPGKAESRGVAGGRPGRYGWGCLRPPRHLGCASPSHAGRNRPLVRSRAAGAPFASGTIGVRRPRWCRCHVEDRWEPRIQPPTAAGGVSRDHVQTSGCKGAPSVGFRLKVGATPDGSESASGWDGGACR